MNKDSIDFDQIKANSRFARLGKWNHIILFSIIFIIVSFVIWAYFAKIDQVTRASGKVIPSSNLQVVQNLEGGIVQKILVKEGDFVKKGQVLVLIDDTQFASINREGIVKAVALKAKLMRLKSEQEGKPLQFSKAFLKQYPLVSKNEKQLYIARKDELTLRIESLQKKVRQSIHELASLKAKEKQLTDALAFAKKELGMTESLIDSGAVSEVEVLRLKREVSSISGELSRTSLLIPRMAEQIAENKNKINEVQAEFKTKVIKELSETESALKGVENINIAKQAQLDRTTVRSPVNGRVNKIYVNTISGVIKPGMKLIDIVPTEDSLLVKARIAPSEVAFLHPGQKSTVRFTAYDFSKYGGLSGQLIHISPDTITDKDNNTFYEVQIRTDKSYLGDKNNPLPIMSGMIVDVDIITGKRTILSYLIQPIARVQQKALREN